MIEETIKKIEARIQSTENLPADKKEELYSLVHTLKKEIEELSKTDIEHARSIAGFTELSTHEATRSDKKPKLLQSAIDGLTLTIDGFESKHPKLSEVINRISNTLSNLGI